MDAAELSAVKRALLEKRLRGAGRKTPAGGEIETGGEGVERPLSFTQEQVWYLNQLQPDSPYYNVPAALRLSGALDVDALHRTLSEIVRRHAVLRSRVALTDGQASARIAPATERVDFPVDSLEHLPTDEREEEARRIVAAEARRPFDLMGGPPYRFRLIRMGPGDHVLTANLHFMAVDAWSWGVFFHELDRLYESYERGLPAPFPELPLQYPDFAAWQRNNLQADVLERHIRFWRERLAGAPEALELPNDLPRPALPSFRGDAVRLTIPEALTAAIRERAAREGTTPFAPILAAYALVLAELAGDDEVMVGSLTTTRTRTELEGLIGLFLNAQPLRIRMGGDPTFREVMSRVRQEALEAYEHRELPLEKLTAEVVTRRDLSRHPLFQAAFVYQAYVATNAPAPRGVGSVDMRAFGGKLLALVHSGTSKYDLTLGLSSATEIYDGQLEYSTDLFHRSTAEALVDRFVEVLAAGVANPDSPVSLLARAPAPAPRVPVPLPTGDADVAARIASVAPERVAVRARGRSWSFAELMNDADRVSRFLRSRPEPPRRVAIVAPAGEPALAAMLGTLRAGAAWIPVDPRGDVAAALDAARPDLILTDGAVPGVALTGGAVDGSTTPTDASHVALTEGGASSVVLTASNVAINDPTEPGVVLTASGIQTWDIASLPDAAPAAPMPANPLAAAGLFRMDGGDPRTMRVTHAELARRVDEAAREIGADDRVAVTESLASPGAAVDALAALLRGAAVCFAGDEDLAGWLRDEGVTVWRTGVARFRATARRLDGTALRRVVLGGEPACAADARLCHDHLPEGCAALAELHAAEEGIRWLAPVEAEPARALLPVGRPADGQSFELLDDDGRPSAPGAVGEIAVEGTRRTGEMGRRLPDGGLLWLGRRDAEARVRGVRVRVAEVEAALHGLPGVEAAAVVGGDPLVAYVQANGTDAESLRRALQERVAAYMVPAEWVLVDALPLTPDGRVDRAALAPVVRATAAGAEEPRTPTERALAAIWATELAAPGVGIDDHFFEIGGHSLRALRVTARVAEALGARVPLRALFEAPRLADYALRVDTALAAPTTLSTTEPEEQSTVLSFGQERLWFLEQLDPESSAYNLALTFELAGELDVDALRAAVNGVVARHEVLRTGFGSDRGRPAPRIRRQVTIEIPLDDLSTLAPEEREQQIRDSIRAETMRPFALETGPLVRFRLQRTAPRLHVLGMVVHHMVFDGWSTGIFLRELAELYAARVQGRAPSLAALPVQFAGFAAWQRERMAGAALERHLAFWRKELAGAPALIALPTDRPRPAAQTFEGAVVQHHVGRDTADRLAALTRRERVTQFMTLLAGYVVILARYTGEDDVVVGAPTAGRLRPEHGGLIGFFVNNLPLRARLDGDPTFREVLARIRATTLEAHEHQEVPFERLVEALQPERSLSHPPLFQVMFDVHSALESRLELAGVEVGVRPREEVRAPFDLNVTAADRPDGVALVAEFNTALFDAATVERFLGRFERLLNEVADHPERRLSELQWLAEGESEQVLTAWNRSTLAPPRASTIHELVSRQAALTPGEVAVEDADARLTYAEVEARSNRLAHWLRRRGVGPEVRVGVLVERGAEMVVTLLGVLKAGGAYVPLDAEYPADRLSYMLADSGAALVLTSSALAGVLPSGNGVSLDRAVSALDRDADARTAGLPAGTAVRGTDALPEGAAARGTDALQEGARTHRGADAYPQSTPALWLERGADTSIILLDREADEIAQESADAPAVALDGEHPAYVIYTSGSTGRPKGVVVPHRGVVHFLAAMRERPGLAAGDVLASVTTLAFDIAGLELYLPLTVGARVAVVDRETARDPGRLAAFLERSGATVMQATPATWQLLVASGWRGGVRAFSGGEALPRALAEALGERCAEVWNLYGPTEATIWATAHPVVAGEAADPVPLGRPIAHTAAYVVDAGLRPVPPELWGELCLGGAQVARGYLDRPGLTAERFVPDPFSAFPGARMYRTGDRARWRADGVLEFGGRLDTQVKLRGYRIEPGEVEAVLRAHPGVREAVVVAREDGGERRLVAYVVGDGATPAALRTHAEAGLPAYMVPGAFVALDRLPLTPSGKVDRRALPAPELGAERATYAAPRTPTEEVLAGIWGEVLGVDRVGAHDHFFALGGHSLLVARVAARAGEAFGREIPLRLVFEQPTVAALAERIDALRRDGQELRLESVTPVARDGALPLSFGQERLWFLDRLVPGSAAYNLPTVLRLTGPLNADAMGGALEELVRRHEVLRTIFAEADGVTSQVILPPFAPLATLVDLTALPEAEREREVERQTDEVALAPFDLAAEPPLRARLLRTAEDEHFLLLCVHHAASDGWSQAVMLREIAALYEALAAGRPSPLAELPVQYADFAAWQRRQLAGDRLDQQLGYWRERLADVAPLDLPTDRPRPAVQTLRGRAAIGDVAASTGALHALAHAEGCTLFMVLLAGWQALLGRMSGQDDVVVGSPIAGRTRPELEGLIGFFVNTLALRTDLGGDPTFRELLARVRETTLGAYQHQELPFERLVEELAPERTLGRNPLVQTTFTLQTDGVPDDLAAGGVRMGVQGAATGATRFDWELHVIQADGALKGVAVYNSDLFDAATADALLARYARLLERMVAEPDRRLSELELVSRDERERVVVEWNRTAAEYPRDRSVHDLVAEQARRTPYAPALVSDGVSLTYAELEARANRLANQLRERGIGPDSRVGVLLERGPDWVIALLATLRAGAAYVPLDPGYPAERLAFMLRDSGCAALLVADAPPEALAAFPGLVVSLLRDRERIDAQPEHAPRAAVDAGALAYVVYTSGSTGTPKGVAVPHRAVVRLVRGSDFARLGEDDRVAQLSNASFDAATWEVWGALTSGAALVLVPRDIVLDPQAFAALLRDRGVTALFLTTALFNQVARHAPGAFRGVRHLLFGGEQVDPAAVRSVLEGGAPERLLHVYGPTENTTFSTWHRVDRVDDDAHTIPIGRPVAQSTAYVLDAAHRPAPAGVWGELYVGGDGVARGYLGRPALTAERFVPDPFSAHPGARLYRTGDRVRWSAEGTLEFSGRFDQQVKVRGFRIEPGEIEAALLSHPAITEAAVVTREDGGERRLVAYVVSGELAADLRGYLRERLPEYMLPAALVPLDALPLTPNGKLDRARLPAPEASESEYVAPRTATEQAVAAAWAEVLGRERVGVHDNFFEIGGHSLLATQVVTRLRRALDRDVPLRALFEAPTVAGLAAAAERLPAASESAGPALVRLSRDAFRRSASPEPGRTP